MYRLLWCFLLGSLVACGEPGEKSHNLIIATATAGGTYYPVGVALGATLSKHLGPGITASAINSAGSGENIQMLINGEVQLAILQGLYGAMAYRGKGAYEDQAVGNLRSITMLWENVEHFLLRASYAKTGAILDLKNLRQRYAIGNRGSGTEGSTTVIFEALGIVPGADFSPEYLGYDASAQTMIDGRIAGAAMPAGAPVSSVAQVYAQLGASGVVVLSFSDEHLSAIRSAFPVWSRHTIAPNTYPGQENPIHTIAQPNVLTCRDDLPEDVVYAITRAIYEHLPEIQNIHKATLDMALDRALSDLNVPLHPGALKFYREQGLSVPSELIVE